MKKRIEDLWWFKRSFWASPVSPPNVFPSYFIYCKAGRRTASVCACSKLGRVALSLIMAKNRAEMNLRDTIVFVLSVRRDSCLHSIWCCSLGLLIFIGFLLYHVWGHEGSTWCRLLSRVVLCLVECGLSASHLSGRYVLADLLRAGRTILGETGPKDVMERTAILHSYHGVISKTWINLILKENGIRKVAESLRFASRGAYSVKLAAVLSWNP